VRFRNTSAFDLVAYFYVDGQRVDNRVIHLGGTYTVREVRGGRKGGEGGGGGGRERHGCFAIEI